MSPEETAAAKAPAKKKKKIPRVKGFSDHESFYANFIGYMSLGMALLQLPYLMVIFLMFWLRKSQTLAFTSFVFLVTFAIMIWFGLTRSKKLDEMPKDDLQAVVTQKDEYFKQLLIIQFISVIMLVMLFVWAL